MFMVIRRVSRTRVSRIPLEIVRERIIWFRIPINEAFCVDNLLARGFQAVTVLDVSQVAIEATKKGK
jgi:hypothetical protein